jgi:hypothetical protein
MKLTSLWDIAPCSFVEADRRFRDACCLYNQRELNLYPDKEVVNTSETSAYFYETTRLNAPEDCRLKGMY